MTANEIRKSAKDFLDNDTDGDATNRLATVLVSEIAAHLADINDTLKRVLNLEEQK